LQPLLAKHHIKAGVWKGHFECAALVPFDIRDFARGVYHCLVDIQSHNSAKSARQQSDATGDHTRAARQIENAVTIFHLASGN
jgi:hypothetical protein